MSRKHKKICTTQSSIEYFLILASTITGSILIAAFASLLDISIKITNSVIGLKICATASGIKKYKSIIKKKKKNHDKIVLLAKSRLKGIVVLISKTLIDSIISHGEFVLTNNVLKEYDKMKEKKRNLKTYLLYR